MKQANSDLWKAIAKARNTRDYENLKDRLGKDLGKALLTVVKEAERADKELDLVHRCITELYNIDQAVPIIQKYLKKIEETVL